MTFLRYLQHSGVFRQHWQNYVTTEHAKRSSGPFAKLQKMLILLTWSIDVNFGLVDDLLLRHDLLQVDLHAILLLLQNRWRQLIATEVASRKDFHGLQGVDFHATFHAVRLSVKHSELLNCIRDGTSFLNKFKAKFDATSSGCCLHCGAEDTLTHRAMECPHYAEPRSRHAWCVQRWHESSTALTHHGWSDSNPHHAPLCKILHQLTERPAAWHLCPNSYEVQHIFTDGSCCFPQKPWLSLASWSCVLTNVGLLLASGPLPGIVQTIDRAELWAALEAMAWARSFQVKACLWTDSSYVKDGMGYLLRHFTVPCQWKNKDLWDRALQLLVSSEGLFEFRKVAAHQVLDPHQPWAQQWIAHWNDIADKAAKRALTLGLPEDLRAAHTAYVAQFHVNLNASKRFQAFLLDLAIWSLDGSSCAEPEPDDELIFDFGIASEVAEVISDALPLDLHTALERHVFFSAFGVETVNTFLVFLCKLEQEADCMFDVTMLELFLAFVQTTKCTLPVQISLQGAHVWRNPEHIRAGELLGTTLASQLKVFSLMFAEVETFLGVEFSRSKAARPSCGVLKSLEAVKIAWPLEMAHLAHRTQASFFARRPLRSCADLARPLR